MMMMLIALCCVEIHALSPVVMIPGLAGSVIKAKLHDAYVLNCVSRTTHSPFLLFKHENNEYNNTDTLPTFGVRKIPIGL